MLQIHNELPLPSEVEALLERYLGKQRGGRAVNRSRPRIKHRKQRQKTKRSSLPPEVELVCTYCHQTFWRNRSVERQRQKANRGGPYCSRQCSAEARSIATSEVHECHGCGVGPLDPETLFRREKQSYCSKGCYLRTQGRLEDVIRWRPFEGSTYCHHCIDGDAVCEVLLGGRWMPVCEGCRDDFVKGIVCVSPSPFDEQLLWPRGSRRKKMLHEIEARGRLTLNPGMMVFTLEWVRP